MWQPYILVGAGLRHFVVANDDFNTSSVQESEDVIHFPVGAGIAMRYEGLVLDLRALLRGTGETELTGLDNANLHSGSIDLKAGWEL